jgi:hypothetical protein
VVVGGWVATLVVAVGISSWAVSLASRQVTDPLPPSAIVDASATDRGDDATEDPETPSPARPTEGTPSASPDGQAATRTVTAVGGRAAFRAEGGRVTLVWATPAAGFDVDTEEEHDGVDVRFRSASHESRIRARHHDGTVTAEVEERPDHHD